MQRQALPEVDLVRDYGQGQETVMHKKSFKASWFHICREVNDNNKKYILGERDYLLRVFCPWDGELYIPTE